MIALWIVLGLIGLLLILLLAAVIRTLLIPGKKSTYQPAQDPERGFQRDAFAGAQFADGQETVAAASEFARSDPRPQFVQNGLGLPFRHFCYTLCYTCHRFRV